MRTARAFRSQPMDFLEQIIRVDVASITYSLPLVVVVVAAADSVVSQYSLCVCECVNRGDRGVCDITDGGYFL